MKILEIIGNKPLSGTVRIAGAKNSAVALIPAALLCDEEVKIYNVPNISDTKDLEEILTFLNAKVDVGNESIVINTKDIVNKSIPIILCDEEDVEGEHGCTIGKLSSDILFYMQTRGISETEIKKLMTKAKIMAVSDEIPNQEIKDKIEDFINKAI